MGRTVKGDTINTYFSQEILKKIGLSAMIAVYEMRGSLYAEKI